MKTYKFKINGNEYDVEINSVEGNIADVTVNGASYKVEMDSPLAGSAPVPSAGTPVTPSTGVPVIPSAGTPVIPSAGSPVIPSASEGSKNSSAPAPAAAPAGAGKAVTSPLPGVIIEVSVKEGQAVKAGQKVAVIEAMKMENEIQASSDGTVTAILVNKGDSVLEGAEIVKIA